MTEHDEFATAPGWRPQPKDKITGVVTDIDTTDLGNGPYPVLTLQSEAGSTGEGGKSLTGEVAVHAFHTVLRRELARRRPQVGTRLAILYLGKKEEGGSYGRGYDVYRVRGGEAGGYDWSRDLPDEDGGSSVPIEPEPVPVTATPEPAQGSAANDDEGDLPF